MLAMLLALAVAQPPAPSPALQGLEFARALEESIANEPGTAPPEPFRTLIRDLGDSSYKRREAASAELAQASSADLRWLFWARMSRDLEVRLRANTIIRRLNPCPSCGGNGRSKHWPEDPCWQCGWLGSAWPYTAWD